MARLSKKAAIQEIIKCGKDPLYFINSYAKIQHPLRGLIPFKTYDYQNDVIEAYLDNRFNIVLKARQLGLTTITAAYVAWFILLHRDKNVLIVATKQDTAKNMIRTIRNIFKYLPKWIKDVAPMTVDNRHSIELDNGSRVKAVATSTDVGRSEAVSFLVVDEAAHIEKFEEIWVGLWPTLSTGGSAALLSTPNGTGNFFHKCFVQASNNENNFNCKLGNYVNPEDPSESYSDRLMWWVHPDHDSAWFEKETKGKSPREIAQEYLCNFNASGDTFLDPDTLQKLFRRIEEPKEFFHANRDVWIWQRPERTGTYLISCDVARGDASDFSAFHVIRIDRAPLEQVAEYKGKLRPDYLGLLLMQVSSLYNNATIAPENNSGWSGQTILKMEEAQFPHIYYSKRTRPKTKDNWGVDPYYAQTRNDYLAGYTVTSANRVPMLAKLEQYVRMDDVILRSVRLAEEFRTFIVKETDRGERPEAQRGSHDDLVMALAGGLWVREEAFMYTYRSDTMTEAMLAGMSTSRTPTSTYSDFHFDGGGMEARSRIERVVSNQNKMVMGNGDEIDLNWLISKG